MNRTKKKIDRTKAKWLTGELTPLDCVCCKTYRKNRDYDDRRMHYDGNGPMCLKCWTKGEPCVKCGEHVRLLDMEICRECYMEDDVPVLADFVYKQTNDLDFPAGGATLTQSEKERSSKIAREMGVFKVSEYNQNGNVSRRKA